MKNTNLILVGIAALLIGGGVGFFAGSAYQKGQTANQRAQFTMMGGNGVRRFGGNGNNSIARGQIISADSNSITVKMQDGSTKIAILGSSTAIEKTTTGSSSDLTNGSTVTIIGATNSDGSITAQSVVVGNGIVFGGPRGGNPTPSGSPAPAGY